MPSEVFSFVEAKKIKIYLLDVVGKFGLFSGDFDDFVIEILLILQKKSPNFLECLRKKKLGCQMFVLSGTILARRRTRHP